MFFLYFRQKKKKYLNASQTFFILQGHYNCKYIFNLFTKLLNLYPYNIKFNALGAIVIRPIKSFFEHKH